MWEAWGSNPHRSRDLTMNKRLKEFLEYISIPLIFLIIAILFILLYKFLGLPSPEELIELAKLYYAKYGYLVVFLGAIIEGALFVNWYLPGSIIMVLGVVFAKQNNQNIFLVIGLIMFGFLLTSILNYLMGKYGWYNLFLKLGLKEPLEKIKTKIENKGLSWIFLTYFHPNVGALTATSAGILKLSFRKFLLYSILAIIMWNTIWGVLVYYFGPIIIKLLSQRLLIPILIIWLIYLTIRFIKHKPVPPVP